MTYSVWNSGTRVYDYYQTRTPAPIHAGAPSHVTKTTPLGATVDDAAYPLPADAVRVGSGPIARGKIARAGGMGLGGLSVGSVPRYFTWALGIAAVLVVGKHLR